MGFADNAIIAKLGKQNDLLAELLKEVKALRADLAKAQEELAARA